MRNAEWAPELSSKWKSTKYLPIALVIPCEVMWIGCSSGDLIALKMLCLVLVSTEVTFYCVSLLHSTCAGLLNHLRSLSTDFYLLSSSFFFFLDLYVLNKILSNRFLDWLHPLIEFFLSKLSTVMMEHSNETLALCHLAIFSRSKKKKRNERKETNNTKGFNKQ